MQAIHIKAPGGLDTLECVDLPDPGQPGPGEIRVRLHGGSLNYHDYLVCSGATPAENGRIPLADGAGIVEAVGEGVDAFAQGDRVVSCFFPDWQDGPPAVGDFARVPGDGIDGFAQEVVVRPATAFTRMPEGLDFVEAATITTAGLTAWRALIVEGGLKAGDTVLVMGTGGVSIWALQIAKAMGARVVATSSSDAKLEKLRAMGADHTINYRSEPEWGEAVQIWTGGRGVDHVVEVGGPATLGQSLQAVRIGGNITLIGVLTGMGGEVPTGLLMAKQVRLHGVIVGSRREQIEFVRAIEVLGLKPVVDKSFTLADLAEAFRYQESGAHFGKIGVSW